MQETKLLLLWLLRLKKFKYKKIVCLHTGGYGRKIDKKIAQYGLLINFYWNEHFFV